MDRQKKEQAAEDELTATIYRDSGENVPTTDELWSLLHGEPMPSANRPVGLARRSEEAWASLIAGPDMAGWDALEEQLGLFRKGLGDSESPIEQMLADQIVISWLEVHYFGTRSAETAHEEMTVPHREFLLRGADRAQRRLVFLTKQFLTIRSMLRSNRNGSRESGPAAKPRVTTRRRATTR